MIDFFRGLQRLYKEGSKDYGQGKIVVPVRSNA
jgi:hypothetical protein